MVPFPACCFHFLLGAISPYLPPKVFGRQDSFYAPYRAEYFEMPKEKYFNQCFATILNKFPPNMSLDDSITIDYYTRALPRDIAVFMKCEARATLAENYTTSLVFERDMLSIGAINDDGHDD